MYKNLLFAAMVLMAAGCTSESFEQSNEQPISGEQAKAPISVRVDGFSVEQGDFPTTRA